MKPPRGKLPLWVRRSYLCILFSAYLEIHAAAVPAVQVPTHLQPTPQAGAGRGLLGTARQLERNPTLACLIRWVGAAAEATLCAQGSLQAPRRGRLYHALQAAGAQARGWLSINCCQPSSFGLLQVGALPALEPAA